MANKNDFIAPATPSEDVATTPFDLSHNNSLSARLGVPYPCFLYDAPGHSSFEIVPSSGFDMMPLASPIQTNIRQHIKFYKIPKRILWKDYRAWHVGHGNFVKPYIHRTNRFNDTGSLADYMNIPTFSVYQDHIDAMVEFLPIRWLNVNFSEYPLEWDEGVFTNRWMYYDGDPSDSYIGMISKRMPRAIAKVPSSQIRFVLRKKSLASWTSNSKLFMRLCVVAKDPDPRVHERYHDYQMLSPVSNLITLVHASEPGDDVFLTPDSTTNRLVEIYGQTYYESDILVCLSQHYLDIINAFVGMDYDVRLVIGWLSSSAVSYGTPDAETIFPPQSVTVPFGGSTVVKETGTDVSLSLIYSLGLLRKAYYSGVIDVTSGDKPFNPFVAADASTPPLLPICALPFRAYEFIGNYFFRNLDIDPFIKPGESEPAFDEYISTDESGADTLTPLEFFKIPAEYDLFTTCMKSPSFGQAPLVRITSYDADDTEGTRSIAVLHMAPEGQNPYNITVTFDRDTQEITAVESSPSDADKTPVHLIKDGLKYGISVQDFMSVSALQRFQDRMQRVIHGHGSKYYNYVREFYGTNPPIGEEFPEYLGGFNSNIEIGKNKAMASNPDADEKLGDFNGSGFIGGQGKKIKCFCSEDCYVLGIVYFTTSFTMSQCLDRHWTKTHYLEDLNPQFTNVIPQPVYKHQIAPLQLTAETLYDVFGFNVPYAEYRQMFDEAHGNYRGNMQHYIIQRLFGNAPQLNKQFIYLDDEQFTDVFEDTSEDDKIFGMIHFDVKAVLPMPRYEIPKIR